MDHQPIQEQITQEAEATALAFKPLSEREMLFGQEYVNGKDKHNGTKCAIAAGYSAKTAKTQASQLLAMPHIKDYILDLIKKREERLEKKGIDAIRELDKIAYANISDYLTFNNNGVVLKDSSELTAEQLAAVKSVEMKPNQFGVQVKITLHDKEKALELLCLHHGELGIKIPGDANSKTAVAFVIPAFRNPVTGLTAVEIPESAYVVMSEDQLNKANADGQPPSTTAK